MARLNQFFVATTLGSVYKVASSPDDSSNPTIEKIANFGKNKIPVGEVHNEGDTIGITKLGVHSYRGRRSRGNKNWVELLENVKVLYWLWRTEGVAGLFLQEKDALECGKKKNLKLCDPRWKEQTMQVLTEVGDGHPFFTISQHDILKLSYTS